MHEEALSNAPKRLLKRELVELEFVVDDSMRTALGELDQRTKNFLDYASIVASEATRRVGSPLERKVRVRLVSAETGPVSKIEYSEEDQWVCRVGSESAMSLSLLNYVEMAVRQRM